MPNTHTDYAKVYNKPLHCLIACHGEEVADVNDQGLAYEVSAITKGNSGASVKAEWEALDECSSWASGSGSSCNVLRTPLAKGVTF